MVNLTRSIFNLTLVNMQTHCLFWLQHALEPWWLAPLLCQTPMKVIGLLYFTFLLNNHIYFTKTLKGPRPSLPFRSKAEEGREDGETGPSVWEDKAHVAALMTMGRKYINFSAWWTKSQTTKLERRVLISFTILEINHGSWYVVNELSRLLEV